MIRVKDLQVGDYFSCGPDDYLVIDKCLIEGAAKIQFIFTKLQTGQEGIKITIPIDYEMYNWNFIGRQVQQVKQEEIWDVKNKPKQEKHGWEPDIVEPFFNIRDTLG